MEAGTASLIITKRNSLMRASDLYGADERRGSFIIHLTFDVHGD